MFLTCRFANNLRLPAICFLSVLWITESLSAQTRSPGMPVRSGAVLNYQFDESAGESVDSALLGEHPDYGKLMNAPQRVDSPFWNQGRKRALRFDALKKQFVRVEHSRDLNQSDAVSLSLFFVSLHAANDAQYHGIVAKQSLSKEASLPSKTNYGIRFNHQKDALQIWIDDGTGIRAATFGAKNLLGDRRLVYLTATLETGDAPAPDADTDQDDILLRLFANGQRVQATGALQGQVIGNDVWITDLKLDGLLNEGPLTIGSSSAEREFTSGVVDELAVFPRALSPKEVEQLFVEVAGADAAKSAEKERQPIPNPPQIAEMSQRGLQIGHTNRLTLRGKNLVPDARVVLPFSEVLQRILPESNASQLIVELTLPENAPAGICPLRIKTVHGISNALLVAIDRLPQRALSTVTSRKPVKLPASFSGQLSGGDQARVYFRGKTGQRIVADVEVKRLGSRVDPVLEFKSERGTPLTIQWGKIHFRGDTRAEVIIPEDGLYYAELHDLSYKAPPGSAFRITIGELKYVDSIFPPALPPGRDVNVELIGSGIAAGTTFTTKVPHGLADDRYELRLPAALGISGPAPAILIGDSKEIVEVSLAENLSQTVDVKFLSKSAAPFHINGRISKAGETDRFILQVVPGQKLYFSVDARAIDSPLDAALAVCEHPSGKVLASSGVSPGRKSSGLDYTVPDKVETIQVSVSDLYQRGGEAYIYRLGVAPAERPRFKLLLKTPQVNLPRHGSTVVTIQVTRDNYRGPIRLQIVGDENVSVSPKVIPKGAGISEILVTLTHNGNAPSSDLHNLKIVGETVDWKPVLRQTATVEPAPNISPVPKYEHQLQMALTGTLARALKIKKLPKQFFQGIPVKLDLQFVGAATMDRTNVIRLSLITTEKSRPGKSFLQPNADKKPLVRAMPDQAVAFDASTGTLTIAVPEDVAEKNISCVVRAEFVPHRYSQKVLGTFFSQPFRLPVKAPVTVKFPVETLEIVKGSLSRFRGTLTREESFEGSIEVELSRLPKGCTAPVITVLPGQKEFEILVSAALDSEISGLPFVLLNVKAAGGDKVLPVKILPVTLLAPHKTPAK